MSSVGATERTRRVLIIDDVVPSAPQGSGYPRMVETIVTIQRVPGATVSLFPVADFNRAHNRLVTPATWSGEIPLEVIREELGRHLRKRVLQYQHYDLIIISRPHNYEFVIKTLKRYVPTTPIVYDAEALFYRRMERQLALGVGGGKRRLQRATTKMRTLEEEIPREVDEVVCVSGTEAELLRGFARGRVTVHSPLLHSMNWTPKGFGERSGVGFIAGWGAGANSPNGDGLRWLAREVWPRVLARLPEAKLEVTGGKPPAAVRRFACESIRFVGSVADLSAYYGGLRVVVAPNRYGAGVKNKTVEALQAGVPVVATAVGAEGMPIPGFVDGTVDPFPCSPSYLTVTDDPTAFATRIVELLTDGSRWENERALLREQCRQWNEERSVSVWPQIIDRLAPGVPLAPSESAASRG